MTSQRTGNFRHVHKIAKTDYEFHHVSVSPCAWNNSAPSGQIFMKFGYLSIIPKSVQKIQVSLKSDKKNGYFT